MARTKKEKKVILDAYKTKIGASKGFILVKPNKITPNEVNEFRKDIFDFEASFNAIKNTIFQMALKEKGLPELEDLNSGEHAVLFFKEEVASPAKALKKFSDITKTKDGVIKIEILNGFYDGVLLTREQVVELAEMPAKEGSISMILGILDNALAGVINVIEDPVRGYMSVIDQSFK